jgi:apolipoprotein N-acyltransferase
MRQVAAVILSALLMWASFPPLDMGFLIFVAPAPFLWALRRVATPREAGWLGFLFGFAFWGGMLWWIIILGVVAWLPLSVVMGLWGTGYALLLYLVRTASPLRWWSVAVGMWALWEFLRARMPFGGFPWGSTGYAVGDIAWSRSAAQWIGATGWGVVAVGVAAGLVLATEEERDRRPLEMSVVVAILLSILGAFFVPDANGPPVRVAIVQGNSPCPRIHCEDEKVRILNNHMALTEQITAGSVDLVVWGEDSFGGSVNPTFNGETRRDMGAQAVRIGAYLLAGGTRPGPPGQFDNYNILFDPSGQVIGEYMKRHPVPFGEYVPFRSLLQIVPQLASVPNDMRRGDRPVVFPVGFPSGDAVLGSVISFEGAFARTIRSEVKAGANLLIVTTNEASYGRGPASDQLIHMVRMSAAALGVDAIHAAVTGHSTLIRADGSVGEKTPLFEGAVLTGTVNVQTSRRTFYAIVGDWVQVLAILAALVVLAGTVGGTGPSRDFKIRPERRR